jgi:hypothetical protein
MKIRTVDGSIDNARWAGTLRCLRPSACTSQLTETGTGEHSTREPGEPVAVCAVWTVTDRKGCQLQKVGRVRNRTTIEMNGHGKSDKPVTQKEYR